MEREREREIVKSCLIMVKSSLDGRFIKKHIELLQAGHVAVAV